MIMELNVITSERSDVEDLPTGTGRPSFALPEEGVSWKSNLQNYLAK